jgi:formate dehydrogenase maturation protein FdhE
MIWELVAALVLGCVGVWFMLAPLVRLGPQVMPAPADPFDIEETERSRAVEALREIEFDRATGKLSDDDYGALKSRYTAIAVEAIRQERAALPDDAALEAMIATRRRGGDAGMCPTCGPRPESDAAFCSSCGLRLPTGRFCTACWGALRVVGQFCEKCGVGVADGKRFTVDSRP